MKIAVVYHSETGNTRKMADMIVAGAKAVSTAIDARAMSYDAVDGEFLAASAALVVGCPTYEGTLSWQIKKFLDEVDVDLAGKLGAAFASQNWPGGGGADLAEINILAGMLVRGMLVYSGGITCGQPYLHFGAVSARAPEGLFAQRCSKLGENVAKKALELFSTAK